jgi:glycosyltransferase involved in cell wall biosynthesis
MKRRLVLITEIIAPYRIPVFNALAARDDIDLHVIFLSETDPSLRQWLVYKDEIHFAYEVLPAFRRRLGKYNLLLNRGLESALKRARPQAILCGGYSYLASWQALCWARREHVPFLLWLESTAADQRRRSLVVEALKRRFVARCQAFVVPGKASRAYLEQFAVPESSIFEAPNAVDNAFFKDHAEQARADRDALRAKLRLPARYFLYTGRLVSAKGVFNLLNAYARLDPALRSVVSLVLVGDGPARSELAQRAARIQPGVVQLTGFVQKAALPSFYALSDVLVFPTHSDTWGFVVNEAMACGLPVVVADVAGCAVDLVEDGWNGKIVPANDAAELASAMQYLAGHDDVRSEMGMRSAQRIAGYSPEACAAGIAEAFAACN